MTSLKPFILETFGNYHISPNNAEADMVLKRCTVDFHPQMPFSCKVKVFLSRSFSLFQSFHHKLNLIIGSSEASRSPDVAPNLIEAIW